MAESLESRQTVSEEALLDELTGLPNRRAFFGWLEHLVEESARTGRIFDVCFVDVDEFKSINDEFGHQQGDLALQDVSYILRHRFGEESIVGRLGGDEFAVLYTGPERLSTYQVSSEVGLMLAELASNEGRVCTVECSIGVASFVRGDSADGVIARADRSMYEEKRARAEARSLRRLSRSA
jgi:diguanylate cyclase (GGDEF)-like protein